MKHDTHRSASRRLRPWTLGLLTVATTPLGVACSGPGNTGRFSISDELAEMVPWVRGRSAVVDDTGYPKIPAEPTFPPISNNTPDEGSRPYDCSKLEGLTFSNVWFDNFEADPAVFNGVGAAQSYSSYDDFSDGVFRTPVEANWYTGLIGRYPLGFSWGMPAAKVEGAPSCNGETNEWVLRFRAGRFNRFGGGMGHPLAENNPRPIVSDPNHPDATLAPPEPEDGSDTDRAGIPLQAADGSPYNQPHTYWDVSAFDGIAFWARRGPDGQTNLLPLIFDKYTSDDLARQNNKFCRRLKTCRTACVNRAPCTPADPTAEVKEYRCFDPEVVDFLTLKEGGNGQSPLAEELLDELYPRCGASACGSASTYPDDDFDGKACRPFTFNTHETGEYCFDEGDPPPPSASERCGDGYGRVVNLTTDWQFYKIPFAEMRQQGHGKISPMMDLTTISSISFVVSHGWADIYLDNVTFYKETK